MSNNILKKILLSTLPLMAIGANAKAPQNINYQSIVRTASGHVVANQVVYVKVEIIYDINGKNTVVYEETHTTNTNFNGSFALKIGEGKNSQGSFDNINWEDGEYSIKTSTSTSEDMSDAAIAISSLSSVPYALYSLHSADSFSGLYDDLKDKPDMTKYATVKNVPSIAADTIKKMLSSYSLSDDVEDLYNRSIRTSNYRIDSLKAITASNRNLISELEAKDSLFATKSDIAYFVKKDTLSTYATKESVSSLKKSTETALEEQSKAIADNKALTDATFNDMKEIHKLYAKKDTMQFFMPKSEMSIYAVNSDVEKINTSVGNLSTSINSTDEKLSNLATKVNTLSSTVSSNKTASDQKVDSLQAELDKVDDKIASSERKAKADDLVLENKITANQQEISKLAKIDTLLDTKIDNEVASLSSQITSVNKTQSAIVDSLAKVVTSNAITSSNELKSQIDSLAKDFDGKLADEDQNITDKLAPLKDSIYEMNKIVENNSSAIAKNGTNISTISNTMNTISEWSFKVNTKNDSLSKELAALKAKYKADSAKMEKRIFEDSIKAVAKYEAAMSLAKSYMDSANEYKNKLDKIDTQLGGKSLSDFVSGKITEALTTAGLNGLSTKVSALDTKIDGVDTKITNVNTRVTDVATTLDNKIDNVKSTLDEKIDDTDKKLSKNISDITETCVDYTDKLETRINSTVGGLKSRIETLETKVNSAE